jgi:hypothetical protein
MSKAADFISAERTLDLATRVTTAISVDAQLPVHRGMSVTRWPSANDTTPTAIISMVHGPWSGSVTVTFRDVAPRITCRIDLDPACLQALAGTTYDPWVHNPDEVHHLTRWSLLLHAVPSAIRRVASTARTHSLDLSLTRPERDITAAQAASEHAA